jgi:hypothetical protein
MSRSYQRIAKGSTAKKERFLVVFPPEFCNGSVRYDPEGRGDDYARAERPAWGAAYLTTSLTTLPSMTTPVQWVVYSKGSPS